MIQFALLTSNLTFLQFLKTFRYFLDRKYEGSQEAILTYTILHWRLFQPNLKCIFIKWDDMLLFVNHPILQLKYHGSIS